MFDDARHDASSFIHVHNFTSTENDGDLDLVLGLQECLGLLHLEINVVLTRLGAQPDFLRLRVMDLPGMVLLALLVLEFAVIHYSADRRPFVRCHLDQIQARFAGNIHRIVGRNNAQLLAFMRDYANGRNSDLVIDPHILAVDFKTLS